MKTSATAMYCAKVILVLSVILGNRSGVAQNRSQTSRPQLQTLTSEQVKAVILAVTDEIYDYSQESSYIFAGTTTKNPTDRSAMLPLYINPQLRDDGAGQVIYRNLPYGEILREFHVGKDGMVVFDSDPQIGFPVTQPSYLTDFMDRTELRQDKARWIHGEFRIQIDPPKKTVLEAAKRQLKRVGFSDFLNSIGAVTGTGDLFRPQ